MLDKVSRRLVKEASIWLYRNHPEWREYPIYYLTMGDKSPKDYGPIVQSLHEIPQLPWPAEDCIICSEDVIANQFPSMGLTLMHVIVHSHAELLKYNRVDKPEHIGMIEPLTIITVTLVHKTNSIHFVPLHYVMTHIHSNEELWADNVDKFVDQRIRDFQLSVEEKEGFRNYMRAVTPKKSFWVCHDLKRNERNENQIGLASDTLCQLANLASPCHYVLKTRFSKGFGPTGEMRRFTASKPIFSFIGYDRLYHAYKTVHGAMGEYEVAPHSRRGHVRHHWRRGIPPLDRFALPDDPHERVMLVHRHKVPRSYIPPMWIGPKILVDEDLVHEIVTEEMQLANL
jgi:hypothetical protein